MSSGSEGQFALTPPASESSVLPSFAQMEGVTPHENIAGRPPQDVETRDLSGDPKSQQEGNCKAEVNSGCTAAPKEDTQHSKLRSEIINRLKKEKNCLESITDEDFKVWQEKAAHDLAGSDAIAIVPIEPETRQARINSINKLISGYRSGKKVYTFGDNAYNATIGTALGAWNFVKTLGKAVGEGAAAGELMQSSDSDLQAEGQRLAQESAQDLKALAKGIIYAPVTIAKQASDGDWGTGVGAFLGPKTLGLVGKGLKLARGKFSPASEGVGAPYEVPHESPPGAHYEAPPEAPHEVAPPNEPTPPPPEPVTAGEPVSVATGEYLETWHDFLVPGALPLDGARYMGLQMPDAAGWPGPLGPCQISVFDEYLDNYAPGHLAFHQADGRRIAFERPFNFLAAKNTGSPHLELTAPWLKQLRLKDRRLLKHFRQYPDGFYRLERIEDLSGNALRLTRDPAGVLLRVERSDGLALAFDNDAAGRRTGITLIGLGGASLRLAAYGYDGNGRMARADCAFGMSVQYEWQPDRPLLARWHNRTRRSETVFSYDESGRVVHTETTGLWNGDRFLYDAQARRTTYLPGGDEAKAQVFAYDAHDNVTAETDALGATTCHSFDRYGFRTATTDAAGYTARTRYDIFGNVKSHIDAEGRETLYGWGPEGQLDIVVDGAGNVRRNAYDAQANLAAETDAEGHRTEYERDAHGRITLTRFPDGTEERRAYDAGGWLASVTDARGGVTRFGYDAFGRLVETTDPLGRTTRLAYAAGPGGFATPTGLTRPDGTTVARAFDPEGALASVTDGEGRTWRYHHGAFDVLEAIEDPNGGTLTLGYDGEGRLTQVTNALGRRYALERDAAGRVVAEVDFDGRVTRYTRDVVGRVSETVRPDGARLVYGYDRTGLVTGIQVFGPDGRRQDQVAYGYDRRGLLVEARNEATRVEYIRDRDGRIVEEDVGGRRVQSRYDACGRRVARRIFSGIDQPYEVRLGEHVTRQAYDPLGALSELIIAECPSSDDLRRVGKLRNGGSGPSGLRG